MSHAMITSRSTQSGVMAAGIWVLLVSIALWLRLAGTTEAAPALA